MIALPAEPRTLAAFALAGLATALAVPVAIAVARRTNFFDHPGGAKGHAQATPYLGGAAVLVGVAVAALALGVQPDRTGPILGGAVLLSAVGTLDDRVRVRPVYRLGAETGVAAGLWALDLGWHVSSHEALNLALTCAWIVGVVNSFNLLDNMDGAAGTLGAVCGAAVAIECLLRNDPAAAVLAASVGGSSLAFLRFNLASPSRIFLGDGGSLPIGYLLATAAMAAGGGGSWRQIGVALVLVGIPVLEMALVVVSRLRRASPLFAGGRDHLTHRIGSRLSSPHQVALTLGAVQVVLAGLAIIALEVSTAAVVFVVLLYIVLLAVVIAILETSPWASHQAQSTS